MEKNQKTLIFLILTIFIITIGICVFLIYSSKTNKTLDSEKFKNEYESLNGKQYLNSNNEYIDYLNVSLPKDNLYVYKNTNEIINIIKNKTGLIYVGNAENPSCRNIVSVLNDAATETKLENIYYLNIENIRSSYEVVNGETQLLIRGSKEYYELIELLDDYLQYYTIIDDDNKSYNIGEKIINSSTVLVVKEGKILAFHENTIEGLAKNEKLNDQEKEQLKKIYKEMIAKL